MVQMNAQNGNLREDPRADHSARNPKERPMHQRTSPLPRIKPLPPDHSPELKEQFEAMRKNLGFIPNSILIMQRKPKLAKALAQMTAAVWDPEGKVDRVQAHHRARGEP